MSEKPPYTDAKFKVIEPKRRWRITFDWRTFLIVGLASVGLVLQRHLTGQ